jgi:serine protease Do
MLVKIKYLIIFLLVSLVIHSCKRRHGQDREVVNRNSIENIKDLKNNDSKNSSTREPIKNEPKLTDNQPPISNNPNISISLSEYFIELEKSVFIVIGLINEDEHSQGSGFFIAPNIGITNYHVIEKSKIDFIKIKDDFHEIIEILDYSPKEEKDYVIFKTNYRSSNYLKISTSRPKIGEETFAIGSPYALENTLTKGTISGYRGNHLIQIDATIDHGSSGGPLFNMNGEVIGVTTSGISSGLNFAVNIQALPYKKYIKN